MQFLNLTFSLPGSDETYITFRDGLNVISTADRRLNRIISRLPAACLYGTDQTGDSDLPAGLSCTLNFKCSESDMRSISLNEPADETDQISDGSQDSGSIPICSYYDFITSSLLGPDSKGNSVDLALESSRIKALLVNNETSRTGFPYFLSRDRITQRLEKELTELNREKQLLELKMMKKSKLLKEIQQSEKNAARLEKRRSTILKYRETITFIMEKNEEKNRLVTKTNSLKKDLIELREIKSKIHSVEKILKEKFSRFSGKGNEQIPDLEQIQDAFSSFRDINEKLDKFFQKRRNRINTFVKIIISLTIFSFISFIFLVFISPSFMILKATSAISASAALLAGIISIFSIRKKEPADLIEEKKKMEGGLIDLLTKNNFPVDGYRTGELYEILFQYFEDFINYRDISNELTGLKKKITNSSALTDNDKKLSELTEQINNINIEIENAFESLDTSIHPRPGMDKIVKTLHEIDDLLHENKTETEEKINLTAKFKEDMVEHEISENGTLASDVRLDEILNKIEECREKIDHAGYLVQLFDRVAESWSNEKIEELIPAVIDKFQIITGNSFIRDDISDSIRYLLLGTEKLKTDHQGLKKYIALSIKSALSDILFTGTLPPVILVDPAEEKDEFAGNIKKFLPELFINRQVIIITMEPADGFTGNIISI